jgi:hypothetical protein
MLVVRETTIHEFPDPQVVINAKDVQGARRFDLRRGAPGGWRSFFPNGNSEREAGVKARSTVGFDGAVVASRCAIEERLVHIKTGFG